VLFVDNFGRKPLLMWGEANMAISHAVLAAVVAVYGGGPVITNKAAGNVRTNCKHVKIADVQGAVFMVYWYIANFAVTWGPLAWVVSAEVFPLDMRAKGMSISSAIK
jgi:MFS family permease